MERTAILETMEKAIEFLGGKDKVNQIYEMYKLPEGRDQISVYARRLHTGRAVNLLSQMDDANVTKNDRHLASLYLLMSIDALKKRLDLDRFYKENSIARIVKQYSQAAD